MCIRDRHRRVVEGRVRDDVEVAHVPRRDRVAPAAGRAPQIATSDGTARGGVLVQAAEQYGLPIHAIGVGEKIDDLRPFDPDLVARVIAGVA